MKYFFWILFILIFIFSCKKHKVKTELIHIDGEFIEANIGGDFFHFTGHSGFGNFNIYNQNLVSQINRLDMSRLSDDGIQALTLIVFGDDLKKENIPLALTLPYPSSSTSVQFQLYDYDDSDNQRGGNLSLTIDKWDDDNYLEGTFEGQAFHFESSIPYDVTGKFRIQVFD